MCSALKFLQNDFKFPCKLSGIFKSRVWIGGKKEGGTWCWNEKQSDPIVLDYWGDNEPNGDGDCLNLLDAHQFKMNDAPCETADRFFCERVN